MTIFEKLTGDVRSAMKSGNKARLETLRFVLSGLQGAQKDKNVKQPGVALTDDETIAVLQKEAKRRKEAIELFRKGNRDDLVKKEDAELAIIYEYIPRELSAAEIEKMVDELKAKGLNDFNSLMRETMKFANGRADGKTVGDIIKNKLG